MKRLIFIIILLCLVFEHHGMAQGNDNLSRLVKFYKNADKECYVVLAQKSIYAFNEWYDNHKDEEWLDYYLEFNLNDYALKKTDISLANEKKVFILSTYINWPLFTQKQSLNMEDYLEIDSTRVFMIACVDDKMHIKGMTDLGEVGLYVETNKSKHKGCCIWVNLDVFHSYKGRNALIKAYKNIPNLVNADAIIFIQNLENMDCLGFIIENKLILWNFFAEKVVDTYECMRFRSYKKLRGERTWEEYIREIDSYYEKKNEYTSIRDSFVFKKGEFRLMNELKACEKYRYGHTPPERIRMCK